MEDKLKNILAVVMEVETDSISEDSSVNTVENWDSLRQMQLVLTIEEEFGIQLEPDDISAGTSYPALLQIVRRLS